MKNCIGLTILFLCSLSLAGPDYPDISSAGKLFTVKIVPGAKNATVNVAGNKTVDLQWDKTGLEAYLILGKTKRPLKISKGKSSFVIDEALPKPSELKLDISSGSEKESINVPIH